MKRISRSEPIPDCGISEYDIQVFLQKQVSEAIELSWVWHQMEHCDFKEELAHDILQSLVSCYMLNMWADTAFSLEVSNEESQEAVSD